MPLILPKAGYFEYEEKRSKFLGFCTAISTEQEARSLISEIRNTHTRANHNVFAYATLKDNITRFSDDGEPSGTAGMPILNVFQKSGVINYVCVVTRYFGGTLLGAGGLVRAYTKAAKGAMDEASPTELIIATLYQVICVYSHFDKLKYNFDKWGIEILEIIYTDICTLMVRVTETQEMVFRSGDFYSFQEL